MWSPSTTITSQNLRQILREAPDSVQQFVLPPGEFEGPFLLDRPIQLAGRGERPAETTLWSRRGPVIIVRSPGVSLDNLCAELTLPEARQFDALIWYAPGCRPDTQGAQIQGRVEEMTAAQSGGGWNLPALIDLGDIRAKHALTLPMVIEVPGPAVLRCEVANLEIQPKRLAGAGQHQISVTIPADKLYQGTMLAGQLVVESGGQSRAVWMIGRVLEDEFKAWVRDRIVLVSQSGYRYGVGVGILLGKEQLRREAGADRLAEKHAYVIKESSGVWCLLQPLPVSPPVRANGQPVGVGRRVILKGGETIELGSITLQVETVKTDLPLAADPIVNLGKVSTRATTGAPSITIQNRDKRKGWEGTLRSTVPWIQVPQAQINCPAGQSVKVQVQLGPGTQVLPRQLINYSAALMLEGKAESLALCAQLDVDLEQGLEVEPTAVDFGLVSGPQTAAAHRLRLRNTGSTPWQGTVKVSVPWLAVDQTSVQCAPGADTALELRLTDQVLSLPEGANEAVEAVTVEGMGFTVPVHVRLQFDKPKVQLEVTPSSIDWGVVANWQNAKPHEIQLRNHGTKDWQGQGESKVPWLKVHPETLRCPAGAQAVLNVSLTERFQTLPVGEQKAPVAVLIAGEGLSWPIQARLLVEAPQLEVDTTAIELVLEDRTNLPRSTFSLRNRGGQVCSGTITSTLRWLDVTPKQVTCKPGSQTEIQVVLLPEAASVFQKPRTISVDDAIQIQTGGPPLQIKVRLEVRPAPRAATVRPPSKRAAEGRPPPEKPPAPPPAEKVAPPSRPDQAPPPPLVRTLDFGRVADLSRLPRLEIQLANTQTQAMTGTVRSTVPWLEVTPASFDCPPGGEIVLQANLTREVTRLRPRPYNVPDAIVIQCGSKTHHVTALVEIAPLSPGRASVREPAETRREDATPDGLHVDFGAVSDRLKALPLREVCLTNTQPQPVTGTAHSTVPWLEVSPARFTCPAGQDIVLQVNLTREVTRLRPKKYSIPDALIVESGGKKHLVTVRVEVEAAGRSVLPPSDELPGPAAEPEKRRPAAKAPEPEKRRPPAKAPEPEKRPPAPAAPLEELLVDFGTLPEQSAPLPIRHLHLENPQKSALVGTVHTALPWLEVTPTEFSCPPGQEVVLEVRLSAAAARLRPKTYDIPDGLFIEVSGKKKPVRVLLQVPVGAGSSLRISPPTPPRAATPPVPKPAPPRAATPPAPKPAPPRAATPPAPKPAPPLPAALTVEPVLLDLGTVDDWSSPLPCGEVQLRNGLAVDWKGTVRSTVPWLEVSPSEVTCPAGTIVALQVRLTRPPAGLFPRRYQASDALHIEGGGKSLIVGASVMVTAKR